MKKTNINYLIYIIISIILITPILISVQINQQLVLDTESEFKGLNSSATYTTLTEIDATDPTKDWAIALAGGLCTGAGTSGNPYIIEDHLFQMSSTPALVITNSRAFFRIENCTFTNPAMAPTIVMLNTSNGICNDNLFGAVYQSFLIDNCSQMTFTSNNCTSCGYSYTISNSKDFTINLNYIGYSVLDTITLDNCIDFLIEDNEIVYSNALGILIDDCETITIGDNLIHQSDYGIISVISEHCSIASNDIYNSGNEGIYLINSEFFSISGNTFINHTNNGMLVENSHNNTVTLNTMINGGIELISASMDNEITSNDISATTPYGIYITGNSQFNLLQNNQLYRNTLEGINFYDAHNNTIIGNNIYENGDEGLHIVNSDDNIFTSNTVFNNSDEGFIIEGSERCELDDNTVNFNQGMGFYIYQCTLTNVHDNNVYDNGEYGIDLFNSVSNLIENNNFNTNNLSGMYFWSSSSNNLVIGNTVNNNLEHGVYLIDSINNLITENTINNNVNHGIYLETSDNNYVTYNTANGNDHGVLLEGCTGVFVIGNILLSNDVCYNETGITGNVFQDNICHSSQLPTPPIDLSMILLIIAAVEGVALALFILITILKKRKS